MTAPSMAPAGVVQRARRPLGWQAPGPRPAAPDAGLGPHAGEDLCYLAGEWRIFQRIAGHRWSLDDLVTAWVATASAAGRPPRRFVDLGCGIGTVLMLVAWRFSEASGLGVEAQPMSVDLARRSLAWNGAAGRCAIRLGDFREVVAGLESAPADLVTGTPPYLTPGRATAPRRAQCGPCHFEERGGIEAYSDAAAALLAPGGRFVVCAAAFQDARALAAMAAAGLVADHAVRVIPRAGKAPLFRVYVARRAGDAAAPTRWAAPAEIVVRDAAGRWTDAFAGVRTAMGMPAPGPRTADPV
ncbi:MAG: methyltransferase [Deltaproteobacteria bacterium]|nr:methyltransferase [Deltaproteobacteria bacterium]